MGAGRGLCKDDCGKPLESPSCKALQPLWSKLDSEKQIPSSEGEVRRAAASFARPSPWRSTFQLLTSFGPFLAGCAAMYLVYPVSLFLTLALSLPTGALLVRVFIIQHDCGHGAFFASRGANTLVGRACSLITRLM